MNYFHFIFNSTSIYKTESHPAPCHSDSSGQTCCLSCSASYTNPSGNLILSKHSSHSSCYIGRYWLQPKVIFKDVVFLTSSSFPHTAGGSVCLPLLHLERCYKNSSLSSDTLFVFFSWLLENESCAGWNRPTVMMSECVCLPSSAVKSDARRNKTQIIHIILPPEILQRSDLTTNSITINQMSFWWWIENRFYKECCWCSRIVTEQIV